MKSKIKYSYIKKGDQPTAENIVSAEYETDANATIEFSYRIIGIVLDEKPHYALRINEITES